MHSPPELPAGIPRVGEIFAEKYRIESVLGLGGMGIVLAATHIHLEERVAIKLLLPAIAENPEYVARFLREGRAAIKIRSEHVGRMIDVGKPAIGPPYLVMEHLSGTDLSRLLEERGPLPVAVAVDYLLQACEALAEAHAMGMVHRDLKPGNLFLTTRPDGTECVKVLDFGISKVAEGITPSADYSMTKSTTLMGSPLYMSPEQLRSPRSVDHRTDIWALGVILFEMLVGVPPFEGDTLPDLSVKIIVTEPPLLRSKRPEAPAALEAIISRCLEKEVGKRVADVAESRVPPGSLRVSRGCRLARAHPQGDGPEQLAEHDVERPHLDPGSGQQLQSDHRPRRGRGSNRGRVGHVARRPSSGGEEGAAVRARPVSRRGVGRRHRRAHVRLHLADEPAAAYPRKRYGHCERGRERPEPFGERHERGGAERGCAGLDERDARRRRPHRGLATRAHGGDLASGEAAPPEASAHGARRATDRRRPPAVSVPAPKPTAPTGVTLDRHG